MFSAHFLLIVTLGANPDLEKATKLVGDLAYTEAKPALEAALKRQGNDRDTMLRIYELQGIVFATLNETAKATKVFTTLMVLDPEHKLSGDYPPRVTTPFYEAKGKAADLGALAAKPLPAAIGNGRIGQLAIEISADPLKMMRKVRFHVKADGGAQADVPADIAAKIASIGVDGARIEWWADIIGDRDAVLVQVGTADAPKVDDAAPAPVAKVEPPKEKPPPPVETAKSGGMSGMRIGGIALAGAGLVAVVVGVAFGQMAQGARSRIDNAHTNSAGQVIDLSQRMAYELDATVRQDATLANVLFGVGAACLLGGVALFLLAPSGSSASVALVPNGPGIALSGVW